MNSKYNDMDNQRLERNQELCAAFMDRRYPWIKRSSQGYKDWQRRFDEGIERVIECAEHRDKKVILKILCKTANVKPVELTQLNFRPIRIKQ